MVSLLLCLAVVGLWVRSYSRPRNWTRGEYSVAEQELHDAWIYSCRGWIAAGLTRQTFQPDTIREKKDDAGRMELYSGEIGPIACPKEWTGEDTELGAGDLPPADHWWEKLGVYAQSRPISVLGGKGWMLFLILPYWVLFLASAIGPGVWMVGVAEEEKEEGEGVVCELRV